MTGWGNMGGRPPLGFYQSMTPVWTTDTEGRELVALGEHLGSERPGTSNGSGPHPFGRGTTLATGRDAISLGDGTHFEVRRYDATGRLARIQRVQLYRVQRVPASAR